MFYESQHKSNKNTTNYNIVPLFRRVRRDDGEVKEIDASTRLSVVVYSTIGLSVNKNIL